MSTSQACDVLFHNGSTVEPAGAIAFRSIVDALAANPHRDGVNQAICSRPAVPWMAKIPPVVTTWIMTSRNTSGMARSAVLTMDEVNSPMIIDTTATSAIAIAISRIGIGITDPFGGNFL